MEALELLVLLCGTVLFIYLFIYLPVVTSVSYLNSKPLSSYTSRESQQHYNSQEEQERRDASIKPLLLHDAAENMERRSALWRCIVSCQQMCGGGGGHTPVSLSCATNYSSCHASELLQTTNAVMGNS